MFMRLQQPLAEITDLTSTVISQTPYAPASVIMSAFIFLIKATDGVSQAYDWVEGLFETLGDFIGRLEAFLQAPGDMNKHLRDKLVEILICHLVVLTLAEKFIKEGRVKRYF
jgi:fungal STAND N-terminal Goodbye domain